MNFRVLVGSASLSVSCGTALYYIARDEVCLHLLGKGSPLLLTIEDAILIYMICLPADELQCHVESVVSAGQNTEEKTIIASFSFCSKAATEATKTTKTTKTTENVNIWSRFGTRITFYCAAQMTGTMMRSNFISVSHKIVVQKIKTRIYPLQAQLRRVLKSNKKTVLHVPQKETACIFFAMQASCPKLCTHYLLTCEAFA